MFQITINEKGGQQRQLEFDKAEVTIGRVQGNDVVLPKGNISKRHSRIVVKDGKFIIIDMQSTNGTYVNGKKITTPQVIKSSDKIYIGDFTLQLSPQNGAEARPSQIRGEAPEAEAPQQDYAEASSDAARRATGLIDEKFDNEFEGVGEPEARSSRSQRRAAPPPREDSGGGLELELGEPEPDPEPEPEPLAFEAEAEAEPEPEPEPEPAPVVPMRGKGARSSASRIRGRRMPEPSGEPEPALEEPAPAMPPPSATPVPAPVPVASAAPSAAIPSAAPGAAIALPVAAAPQETLDRRAAIARIHQVLATELNLASYELRNLQSVKDEARRVARKAGSQIAHLLPKGEDATLLARAAVDAALDFSAIQPFVEDDEVLEVVVTHQRQIFIDREGRLEDSGKSLESEEAVVGLIRRLAVLGGLPAECDVPLIDVRLRDGARVIAARPPLAFRGSTLCYRKATREAFTLDDFVHNGTLDERMMKFIDYCVRYRQGMMVSVGPGVGASATLNAIASLVPADERIVTIESGVELSLGHVNVTALEPSDEAPVERLVEHAVALLPERALIGLISGSSAYEVLSAMAGPLEGSACCYAAPTPEQALDRLARVEMAEKCSSLVEARRLVANAVKVILQEERFADGSRRITKISEITTSGENVATDDIFVFESTGIDDSGLVQGSFRPTGTVPSFLEELQDQIDTSIFQA